ncbi:MAG: hypothetical protein IT285_02430 [Bdellovibrionales bacterium]|nr:hypothetical protein [Bdellovibrionales bacterium]
MRLRPIFLFLAAAASVAPRAALAVLGDKPEEAVRAKPGDTQEINPFLKESIEETVKRSLRVDGEQAGFIVVDTQGKVYTPGTYVLFFRKTEVGLDMMARGEVQSVEAGMALVKLDLEEIIKVPAEDDLAVPLASPSFASEENEEEKLDVSGFDPPDIPGDPGYIHIGLGYFNGDLSTDSDTSGNAYKIVPGYRFSSMIVEWYPEFIWRWGLEWESYSGVFPTSTYYREDAVTDQSYSKITVNYRFRRMFGGKFRPTLRLHYLVDEFRTTNPDEAVISSDYVSLGLGVRFAWEFNSVVWTTRRLFPFMSLHRIYLDGSFYPLVSALDVENGDVAVLRGTEGSGSAMEWRVGVTGFLYFYWIPFLKRWEIDAHYGVMKYNLAFSGQQAGDTLFPEGLAPNTVTSESYTYWSVSVGVRLDDFICQFLKPTN